ncbi:hypothetical protein CW736_07655 [Nonlabens sp. MB-3u-79]|uniref:hypothetical protein n=1 Tax=Nonlabens sp. MB-3u-79 TaxID=2058134 RepID=UPI000C3066D3|nr:hypothetical protein [Nonlabens sp. MB-3u-79]AUC79264.1 hypothetical protein CW736_07655 [Nonlabens sp. MB-3u-79]
MKNRIYNLGKKALTIWGGISLIGIILILGYLAYSTTIGNKTVENKATKSDVRFVLNWCRLGDERIEKVTNSYESGRSFTGDFLDAYAIDISKVTREELKNKKGFYRLDSLPKVLKDAVEMTSGWEHEIPWFPKLEDLKKEEVYVYPWSIYCNGVTPTGAELIYVVPKNKKVYYIGTKM